jgi:hypothetical protein
MEAHRSRISIHRIARIFREWKCRYLHPAFVPRYPAIYRAKRRKQCRLPCRSCAQLERPSVPQVGQDRCLKRVHGRESGSAPERDQHPWDRPDFRERNVDISTQHLMRAIRLLINVGRSCIECLVDPISCLIGYWGFYRRLYSMAARGGCNDEIVQRIRPAGAGRCRSCITDTAASCRRPAKETRPSSQAKR